MTHLVVCLPQTRTVASEYSLSLAMMALHIGVDNRAIDEIHILVGSGTVLQGVRQNLAERAIEVKKATHLLWIDSDHSFPNDTAHRLLAHKRPFVGINATTRVAPVRTTAQKKPGEPLVTNHRSKGLERVHRVGISIALIEARVFQTMPKPWFATDWVEKDGKWASVGEDYYFCEKAKAYGFHPMVDHDLTKETTHIGTVGFNTACLEE